jgi:glycerophosphoryl diester phosphodiesterase
VRIGHRGAAALEPENTLRSFRRAIELGVDFVELDVLELADRTLVVAHSDDLFEISHGAVAGTVASLPVAALREAAPELPMLDEALDFLAGAGVGIQIDVKQRWSTRAILGALRRHGVVDRSVASSFWRDVVRDLRRGEPALAVGVGYPDDRYGLARRRMLAPLIVPSVAVLGRALPRRLVRWLQSTGASVAMLHWGVVSPEAVRRAHAFGAAVWAWTVNSRPLLERLTDFGVDGVITDDPRLFLQ